MDWWDLPQRSASAYPVEEPGPVLDPTQSNEPEGAQNEAYAPWAHIPRTLNRLADFNNPAFREIVI